VLQSIETNKLQAFYLRAKFSPDLFCYLHAVNIQHSHISPLENSIRFYCQTVLTYTT